MYECVTADMAGTQIVRSLVLREGFKMLQKKHGDPLSNAGVRRK
jgi:hypothetical protein